MRRLISEVREFIDRGRITMQLLRRKREDILKPNREVKTIIPEGYDPNGFNDWSISLRASILS